MFAILIIAGLTSVNQLLALISDWHTIRTEKGHSFLEFIKLDKLKIVSFFVALTLTVFSAILSYDTEKSTNELIGNVDTAMLKVDTVKVLADSMQRLQVALATRQNELANVYKELNKLQTERHNEIIGGDSPPTLKIESRISPFSLVQFDKKGNKVWDSLTFHVALTFCFINQSPYVIKSARVAIEHLDYLNQKRFLLGTYKKDPGVLGIMKFNRTHEVHDFNTLQPDPEGKISKRFTVLVPLEGYDIYQFFLSVEWSNGYYGAQIDIKPDKNFNSKLYFQNAAEYGKIFKLVPTKAEFTTLQGRKKPKFIFVHEPNTPFRSGELRNE